MLKVTSLALIVVGVLGGVVGYGSRDSMALAQEPKRGPKTTLKKLDLGDKVTMNLVLIPAGHFDMGSPGPERPDLAAEQPQRRVRITKPFYMGVTEVTQQQYMAIMDNNPSHFPGVDNPVETVSWHDAVAFCRKLSQKAGKTVRLPTEAEWEYACRAGSATIFCFGDDETKLGEYAWYTPGVQEVINPHAVAQKKTNAWGLYDMHGNVEEWCSDWFQLFPKGLGTVDPTGPANEEIARAGGGGGTGRGRVIRGGTSWVRGVNCRSASRRSVPAESRHEVLGFRVVLEAGMDR